MQEQRRLSSWGKSMYGGWYVNLWALDGSYLWDGYHFDKLPVLRSWAREIGVKLDPARRYDN